MRILITGGSGYIGSHAALIFLQAGFEVVVVDNFSNSSAESLVRVQELSRRRLELISGSICDYEFLIRCLLDFKVDAVVHFAGLKSIEESFHNPLAYFENNVGGSLSLFRAMADVGIFKLIFSSSATVYGDPLFNPVTENHPLGIPTNPYGYSKLVIERVLDDLVKSNNSWKIGVLRYFNPVGAHISGRIGEDPSSIPSNLFPYISKVVTGGLNELIVFGNDYPTADGTGVRDYIHVVDLAEAHLSALNALGSVGEGLRIWNIGTGIGYSVLDVIRAFERISCRQIPYRFAPRRPGDISQCFSDPTKAENELGWKASRSLEEMVRDAYRWQSLNPNGYKSG